MNKKAWLILSDGTKLEGISFGAETEVTGEIVFATNMTGFQESLTDPNFRGQILVQTFPLVGNVGVNQENIMSESGACGLVVREYCDQPSNFREVGTLSEFMKQRGIAGISGIDTRRLTRILREGGEMTAVISASPEIEIPLVNTNCEFTEIYSAEIAEMKKRIDSKQPIFAVEQEHLFLAAAMGGEIYKLPNGHRGCNQPVKDLRNGNVYVTKQAHGYAVRSIPADVGEVIFENVNDKTIEGIKYKSISALSVQFMPSENGGGRNTLFLQEEFKTMKGEICR